MKSTSNKINTNLPHNEEAERATLGALISSPTIRNELLNTLVEDDFYVKNGPNQLVFKAISNLANNGAIIDLPSLTNELGVNMKVLEKVGGVAYLVTLEDCYIGDRNALFHVHSVKDLALSRRLISCLNNCVEGFYKNEFSDVGQYIAGCEKNILEITQQRRVSEFEHAGDIVENITSTLKLNRGKKIKNTPGVSTGFRYLDYYTQGWQPGQLIILAARPSVGKTAFALNLAYNAANTSGKTVAFFSLEMDATSIVKRLLAFTSQINSTSLNTGDLTDDDWISLDSAVKALKETKLLIDDTPGEKLNDIKTKVQKLKAQEPDLACIFIDYLGLITTNMNAKGDVSRQQEVAEISRQLKALAREVEVPIVCLSQLSRASEQRSAGERMPKLSDLRDSGSIEQDADLVLFIHRDNYQNAQAQKEEESKQDVMDTNPFSNATETKINVAKNRNGKTGVLTFTFFMNCGKFAEIDKTEEEQ